MSSAAHGRLRVGARDARWLRQGPLDGRPVVLLAHGAGAALRSAFLEITATGLRARGCTVVRFHFPYMERVVREGRRRPPDPMPVLLDTWRALLDKARGWTEAGPLVMAGKSLGGRVASLLLAEGRAPEAAAAVYLGYPLHPPGRQDRLRDAHLRRVRVPQLFVSGDADPLARLDLLRAAVAAAGPGARLWLVPGGDHSLQGHRRPVPREADSWLDGVAAFVHEEAARRPRRAGNGPPRPG